MFRLLQSSAKAAVAAPIYSQPLQDILAGALVYAKEDGFTDLALRRSAQDLGYSPMAVSELKSGSFDLIRHFIATERKELEKQAGMTGSYINNELKNAKDSKERLNFLMMARLRKTFPYISKWQAAAAISMLPTNAPAALSELMQLSDVMANVLLKHAPSETYWEHAKLPIAATYLATEIFMTQETSPKLKNTKKFLERRLDDLENGGKTLNYLSFNVSNLRNTLNAKGFNI